VYADLMYDERSAQTTKEAGKGGKKRKTADE
jgi:hypothetical protein